MEGAMQALEDFGGDLEKLYLVGDEEAIKEQLSHLSYAHGKIEVVPSTEVVGMEESAVKSVRSKKNSSISVAVDLVKKGDAEAVVSAGNTGAAVAASTIKLRTIPGVERAGIASPLPNEHGPCNIVDAGANVDAKASHLLGPAEHDGVASAALVGAALGAFSVAALEGLNPSVVGDVDDQGIFGDAGVVEMLQELATGLVEPFAHGVVLRDAFGDTFRKIFVEQALGRIVRRVGQFGSIPNKEWVLVSHRAVDEFENRLHAFASYGAAFISSSSTGMRITFGHSFSESASLIGALPPFAALVADITFLSKPLRQCSGFVDMRDEQFAGVLARLFCVSCILWRVGRIVAGGLVLVRIESRGNGHKSRATQGSRYVAALEEGALRGQLVQMRRLDVGMPHEAVVGVALVV